jgi:hypothetical protein
LIIVQKHPVIPLSKFRGDLRLDAFCGESALDRLRAYSLALSVQRTPGNLGWRLEVAPFGALEIQPCETVPPFCRADQLGCGSCALNPSGRWTPFGPDDYAFMGAQPYPQETALAQKRFRNFLRRANAKGRLTLAKTPYVAVRAYQLTASEVPGLTLRMALGRIPMTYYGSDLLQNPGSVPVAFLLIFDQRTGRLAP